MSWRGFDWNIWRNFTLVFSCLVKRRSLQIYDSTGKFCPDIMTRPVLLTERTLKVLVDVVVQVLLFPSEHRLDTGNVDCSAHCRHLKLRFSFPFVPAPSHSMLPYPFGDRPFYPRSLRIGLLKRFSLFFCSLLEGLHGSFAGTVLTFVHLFHSWYTDASPRSFDTLLAQA